MSNPLTPETLDEITAMLREATPGEWTVCGLDHGGGRQLGGICPHIRVCCPTWVGAEGAGTVTEAQRDADAALIATLCNHAEELVRLARVGLAAEAAHLNRGSCPEPDLPDSRDPECPACQALGVVEIRCCDCKHDERNECSVLDAPAVSAHQDRGVGRADRYDLFYARTQCPGFTAKETT